jgi:hypothetical protein
MTTTKHIKKVGNLAHFAFAFAAAAPLSIPLPICDVYLPDFFKFPQSLLTSGNLAFPFP